MGYSGLGDSVSPLVGEAGYEVVGYGSGSVTVSDCSEVWFRGTGAVA